VTGPELALLAVILGLVAAGALAYWHLIIAEGAYLGPRVVAWTYDWVARRYDAIKQFDVRDEDWFVAGPVLRGLAGLAQPLVLDVATGTGRLPLAVLRTHPARGTVRMVGLDLSRGMLRQARAKLAPYGADRVILVWQDAAHLPFADDTFDAVTCLEALEFLPNARQALAEMTRVLAPGGLLLVTNRVGSGARLMPGRTIPRAALDQLLADLGLEAVETRRWQVDYDLSAGRKAGARQPAGHGDADIAAVLRCPACGGQLRRGAASLMCIECERVFRIEEGVIALAGIESRGHQKTGST
jgi:ubiquinone/menaquinone biosynthesis C-methylase UbiE